MFAFQITGKAGRCHIDPVLFIPIKLGTINWERRPSIAPSEVGPDFSESSPANVGDNIYQAEYLSKILRLCKRGQVFYIFFLYRLELVIIEQHNTDSNDDL